MAGGATWDESRQHVMATLEDQCERLDGLEAKIDSAAAEARAGHQDLKSKMATQRLELIDELNDMKVANAKHDARWSFLAAGLSLVSAVLVAVISKYL